jgi:hypothetical protein
MLFATVRHEAQRYPTAGDYQEGHGVTLFTISDMHNDDYEALVAIHELVEYLLVRKRGISMESIDAFDKEFEAKRLEFDTSEPGWHPKAPYHHEHVAAEGIEKQVAALLGVDWDHYDKTVSEL